MASPKYAEPTMAAAAKVVRKARVASNATDSHQNQTSSRAQTRSQTRSQTAKAEAAAARPEQAENQKRQPGGAIIESKLITEPGSSGDDLAQYYQQQGCPSDSKKTNKPVVSCVQRSRQILRFLDETPKDTLSTTWKWLEAEEDKSQLLTRTESIAKAEAECEDEEKWPSFLSTKSDGQICGYLKTNLPKWVTSFEAQAQAQAPQADPVMPPLTSKAEGEERQKTRVEVEQAAAAGPLGDKLNEMLAKSSFKSSSGRRATAVNVNSDDGKSKSLLRALQCGTEDSAMTVVRSGEESGLWSRRRIQQSQRSPLIYFQYSSSSHSPHGMSCLTPSTSPTQPPRKHFVILPELGDGSEQHRFAVIEWEWTRRWVNLHNQGRLQRSTGTSTNSNNSNNNDCDHNNNYIDWWLHDRKEDDLNPVPDWVRKEETERARHLGVPEPVYPKKVKDGMHGVPGGFGVWVKKDSSWVRLCKGGTAYRRVKGGVFSKCGYPKIS